MTREQAERVIRANFTEVWANGIIKALEPKPMEKFKSVKDHIFKLAGDYKCWDNRLTDDEALELCHILEQEPRKGHWIETTEEYYKAINEKGGGVNEKTDFFTDDIACSECLAKFSVIDNETERFDFCPNCGADMRGKEE